MALQIDPEKTLDFPSYQGPTGKPVLVAPGLPGFPGRAHFVPIDAEDDVTGEHGPDRTDRDEPGRRAGG